jgi:hypothetical protein
MIIIKKIIWCAYLYAFGQNMGKQTYMGPFTLIEANHGPLDDCLFKNIFRIFRIKKYF